MQRILAGSYANSDQPGVYIIDHNKYGEFTIVSVMSGVDNPSFLARRGDRIWSVSETNRGAGLPGGVVAITRNHHDALNHGPRRPSGGDWPCHIAICPQERFAVVANYGTGNMALLKIDADGSLSGLNDLQQHRGSGPHSGRQEGPHAHSSVFTPDGRYVIAADLGTDELVVYRINEETTTLERIHHVNTPAGNGPRHTVFHPNGQILYVANELACSVSVYRYFDGQLEHVADHSTIMGVNHDYTVADIHISPDSNHLYVTTRTDNTIAAYQILADGNLQRIGVYDCGGKWPRNFAISPDGTYLLVACQHDNYIAIVPRNPSDGTLDEPLLATIPVPGVSFVEFWS